MNHDAGFITGVTTMDTPPDRRRLSPELERGPVKRAIPDRCLGHTDAIRASRP
ncbi:protein of unknown function [Methylocaldum szegediense]|uniref:Uncharacterized protein n=1 Tax=Methylocaldum szegediense TaxID=73780 RepID=A0ABN8X070_9GAMM|nr:protein of unknown function [Methylocaldum szegediense]